MIIPEIIIYNTLKGILQIVKDDYIANPDTSILKSLLGEDDNGSVMSIETYNYLDQAASIFTRRVNSERQLTLNLGYNTNVLKSPAIHVLMPSETDADMTGFSNEYDSYSDRLNDLDDVENDAFGAASSIEDDDERDNLIVESNLATPNLRSKNLSFGQAATYALMVTSDNSTEVVLVYHVVKNLLHLYRNELSLLGFINLKIGGGDIVMQSDLVPMSIFHRNLSLTFSYESLLTKIYNKNLVNKVKVMGTGHVNIKY